MQAPRAFLVLIAAAAVAGLLLVPAPATAGRTTQLEATGPQPVVVSPNGRRHVLYEESHALLISVSEYAGAASGGWDKLRNTASEVDAVAQALRPHGFSVTRVVDPTGDELVAAFRRFLAQHGQKTNVRLVVFFSGHGYTNPVNDFGYVVPADAKSPRTDPVDFYAKALPIQQVELWAREVVSKHALFMFDSCFSGSIFSTKSESVRPDPADNEASTRWRFLQGRSQEPVRQFISAGGANELLPGRSDFVPMLLHALRYGLPKQGDGFFTGKGLGLWLEESLPSLTGGKQNPQSGVVRSPALALGDMVFQVATGSEQAQAPVKVAAVPSATATVQPAEPARALPPSAAVQAAQEPAGGAAMRLRLVSTHGFEWPEAQPGYAVTQFTPDGSKFFVAPVLRWRATEGPVPEEIVLKEGRTAEATPSSAMASWRLASRTTSGGYFGNDISELRVSGDQSTFTILDASWARVMRVQRTAGPGVKWIPAVEPRVAGNGNIAVLDKEGRRALLGFGCASKSTALGDTRVFSIWDVRSGKCQPVAAAIPRIVGGRHFVASEALDRFAVAGHHEIWMAEREPSGSWKTSGIQIRGDADFSWVSERGTIGGYTEGLTMAPDGSALVALTSCSFDNRSRAKVFRLVGDRSALALPPVPGCVKFGSVGFVTDRLVVTATATASAWHLRVFDARTGQLSASQDFPGTVRIRSFAAHHESRTLALTLLEGDDRSNTRQASVRVFRIE